MRQRLTKAYAKWRKLVSEQACSGKSVAEFCRERGLHSSYFWAWKKRLRESAAARFLEVQVTERAPLAHDSRMEIRLRNGRSVVVEQGFDAQQVRALLAVVAAAQPRCEVVGTANNGHALLEAALTLQPEVIVLDIAMPEMNGLTAAGHLKHSVPKAKLVFLTMNEDPELVGEASRARASAFLLKQSAAFELTDAVEKVLKGGSYVTPRAAKGQTNIFLRGPQAREKAAELTLRQREIIQLMAEGRSSHLRIRKQSFWRSRSCNDRPVQRHLAGQRVFGSNQTTASASSVVLVPHMR